MDTQQIVDKTKAIRSQFSHRSTHFDVRDRMLDLMEEMGELAHALMMVEKRKHVNVEAKQATKADVADALSDMLFDMIIIAEDMGIDMFKDYERMLTALQERIDKGEYDNTEALKS